MQLPDNRTTKGERIMDKVNLSEKFSLFTERWSPKIVGQVNDMHVKIGKIKGEFEWHSHENEDEMFLVVDGRMILRFRDKDVIVNPGEFIVVPKGVEHMPVADEETQIMMFEPAGTVNTGDNESERQVEPEWL